LEYVVGAIAGFVLAAAVFLHFILLAGSRRKLLEERNDLCMKEIENLRRELKEDSEKNAGQAREIQQHRDLAILLPEFVKQIFSARKAEELAEFMARAVKHMTGAAGIAIFLADRTGRRLSLDFQEGLSDRLRTHLAFGVGEGHVGFVSETGRIFSAEEFRRESVLVKKQIESSAIPGYVPDFAAPMMSQGVLFGVLCLNSIPPTATLVRERVRAIAAIGAAANENIRLLERFEIAADLDPDTALPGRNQLSTRMDSELERVRRFSSPLSLIELQIPQGSLPDRLLAREVMRMCANHLKAAMRNIDTGIRISRDSILLLLPGTGEEGLEIVMSRLAREIPGTSNEEGDRIDSVRMRSWTCQPSDDLSVETALSMLDSAVFQEYHA